MTNTDKNTAIVPAPSAPAQLTALERYGRSGGNLFGELSGKTGSWTSGAQGVEVPNRHPARGARTRAGGWLC